VSPFDLKDYEPVEDRLRAFWQDHPEGRVITTLIDHADGSYIVYAEVWRVVGDLPAASGLAHDSEAQLPPNMKASALEVAETSAIGRALANLGYAAKGKRPSREEMSKTSPAAGPRQASSPSAAPSRGVASTADSGQAGGTSSASPGEVEADLEPGEESAVGKTSPGFPIPPEKCDHKTSAGRWVKWVRIAPDFQERCPKCGLPKLTAMEGTTADLGPA